MDMQNVKRHTVSLLVTFAATFFGALAVNGGSLDQAAVFSAATTAFRTVIKGVWELLFVE
jgi:hypothetical protein